MKNLFSLSLLLLLLTAFNSQAKIWRVNNNAGINADFATAQAAHDAASVGDTIFLEPSATQYSVTATKALVWLGMGVQIGSNYPEYFTALSKTTLIPTDFIDGSFYVGLELYLNPTTFAFNNVVFDNCEFVNRTFNFSGNNNKFTKCFLSRSFSPNSGNGLIINNCIFFSSLSVASGFTNAIISNCIFNSQIILNNSTITNCIYTYGGTSPTLNFCNFSNNIDARTGETAFGTANGNIGDVTLAEVFEDISSSKSIYKYQLKAGGPAINTGFDGTDIGVFGGFDPIIYPGRPGIPFINNLLTTGIGNDNTALKVNISVESGN